MVIWDPHGDSHVEYYAEARQAEMEVQSTGESFEIIV